MNKNRTQKYVNLITQFLDHHLNADDFEAQYLNLFKNETVGMSIAEYSILEQLFSAVDAYCPDPTLRSEEDLDENQLRDAAKWALSDLLKI